MTDVPSNLIPTRITQLPLAPVADENSLMLIVYQGNNYQIRVGDLLSVAGVPITRQVIAGTGMAGGGQLSSNVTLSIAPGGVGSTQLANSGVTPGSYGTATDIPVFTVDATGRVMAATTVPATISGYVPESRQVIAGTGLTGGGALTSNVTLTANLSNATPQLGNNTGSAGVSTAMSRADHVHPAVDLSDQTQINGILPLDQGGTARSLVANAGAVVWSGADGLYIGPAGTAGQVLISGGAGAPTWGTALVISDQPANVIYGGPASGPTGPVSFRSLVTDDLPSSGVSAGTYGSASSVATFTANVKGQVTSATNTSIAISGAQITSGTVPTARLASGTADSTTFLRGDQVWAVPSGGGGSLTGVTQSATPFETALGFEAGLNTTGTYNTWVGYQSGRSNTTGVDNAALGTFAGFGLTTGATNTLVGSGAGNGITTGSGNTGVGYGALGATNQQRNTAVGYYSLSEATGADNTVIGYGVATPYAYGLGATLTGASNVGIGSYALGSLRDDVVSATRNVAVGFEALGTAGSGARNVAVGAGSLTRGVGGSAVNGSDNVALGDTAGDKITTGNQNTVLGSSAASSGTNDLTTGSNNTIIGYNAASSTATISNQITLGNSSIATLRCQVTTITSLSDARDKSNISDLPAGLTFVQGLRPVQFEWSMRDGGKIGVPDTGFIAQDLQAVQVASGVSIPGLVYDDNPDRLEAGYGKLLPVLVKAIQELAAEVEALKAQIAGQ